MILGTGIDIVRVQRLSRWKTVPGLCERWFHPAELAYARTRGAGEAQSLAARFAAKEAFGKALGTRPAGFALTEVEVLSAEGRPELRLFGRAREALRHLGGERVFLSLAHEADTAVAMVVIEG
ncbi:MAG: holo-ACP synthase [Spirochaetales bacterium]|jgi:holo-[acyl-carrier protein] synthase|nr:holo-ACP synthase [Spirochaetales bacterium]